MFDASPLISKASNAESKVLYHKMAGDYYRYIAEFTVDAKKEARDAMDVATKEFPVTHSFRLGLALDFLVFLYEVLGNPDKACEHHHWLHGRGRREQRLRPHPPEAG